MTDILYPTKNSTYQNKYVDEYDALLNQFGHVNYIANATGSGTALIGQSENAFRIDSLVNKQANIEIIVQSGECVVNSRYYKTDTTTQATFKKINIRKDEQNRVAITVRGDPAEFQLILPKTEEIDEDKYIEIGNIDRQPASTFIYEDFQDTRNNQTETAIKYNDFQLPDHAQRHQFQKNDLRSNHVFGNGVIFRDAFTETIPAKRRTTVSVESDDIREALNLYGDLENIRGFTSTDSEFVVSKIINSGSEDTISVELVNTSDSEQSAVVSVLIFGDLVKL